MESISACRVCGSRRLQNFFELGKQPLANSLLRDPFEKEVLYPLSLSWCHECNLVQLNQTVDPRELFSNYIWTTGTSRAANDFAKTFFQEFIKRSGEEKGEYVLEVASNDGTFLVPFMETGHKVLGIDPAQNLVDMANANGVPTRLGFFGTESAEEILKKYGPARMVLARNVLPHVANTLDFVEGLARCLDAEGMLAIEVHYAKVILEELHYDSIYHEHLCYFTLQSLERLLNRYGLFIFDLVESPISGGSLIVYTKKHRAEERPSVEQYREREIRGATNELKSWEDFARRSSTHKDQLATMLQTIAARGGQIVGWGASARSSTLLNFCGIDARTVSCIADRNPLKQKLFTAGTRIPIENPDSVMSRNPTSVFLLAWNFADEIMENLETEYHYRGSYLIPLPRTPRIQNNRAPLMSARI